MIIRRRHTKNFTIIGNELFNDERLALDEVGLLGFLLSQPNDWEVRRPALRKRWKVGRDGIKRIIDNLIRTGWCRAEKTRLSNGTFSIVYTICDEPGPSLSDEEVRRALSLVSSEAAEEPYASDADESPEPCAQPPTCQPALDHRILDGRQWQESLNTDSTNTNPTKAPAPIWRDLRAAWPPGDILSPLKCEQLFAALSLADRQLAIDGSGPYLANCRARNRKVCDLSTYLKERRFVGKLAVVSTTFPTMGGTPQAFRWLAYRKAVGEQTGYMEDCWRQGKPWYAPSEWPPAIPLRQSTGPPSPSLMTSDDEEEAAKEWG